MLEAQILFLGYKREPSLTSQAQETIFLELFPSLPLMCIYVVMLFLFYECIGFLLELQDNQKLDLYWSAGVTVFAYVNTQK